MITPNLQSTLFATSKDEALTLANTSESLANLWFKQNYLSFDISIVNQLQHPEVLELTFVSKLFNSTLNLDTINQVLLKLKKPYAYNYSEVYFNVFSNEWEYIPIEKDEEDVVDNYLENLNTDDDREKIEIMINKLKERLN
jgi:hypothetical protein